jgi:hypothetical protein
LSACSGKFAGTGGAGVRDRRSNFHVSHAFRHSSGLALWSRPSFSARRRVRAAACFCMTNSPATKSSFRPYFLARNPARFCVGKLRNNIFVATRNVLGTGGLCLCPAAIPPPAWPANPRRNWRFSQLCLISFGPRFYLPRDEAGSLDEMLRPAGRSDQIPELVRATRWPNDFS